MSRSHRSKRLVVAVAAAAFALLPVVGAVVGSVSADSAVTSAYQGKAPY